MADFFVYIDGARTKQQRYVDNGDGTWSPEVYNQNSGSGGSAVTVKPGPRTPLGYSQITAVSGAVTLASGSLGAIPVGATIAVIEAEGNDFRYRTDNVTPTISVGERLLDSQTIELAVNPLSGVKFFPMNGVTTGIINIHFYS